LIYKYIKTKAEKYSGRTVSDDYIWDLFKRHNWKKKSPHSSHPKADREKQDEYKKLPELPVAKLLEFHSEDTDARPVKLFFQDEARFSRIDNIASYWFS
jgi:hypothetical protein